MTEQDLEKSLNLNDMTKLKKAHVRGWSTKDEMESIDFIASPETRENGRVPTKRERLDALNTVLKFYGTRRWTGRVNIRECATHLIAAKQRVLSEQP